MKKNILTFSLVLSLISIKAQINFGEYEEPDGTFERLFVTPNFFYNSDFNGTDVRSEAGFESDFSYQLTSLDTFSTSLFSISGSLNYEFNNQSLNNYSRLEFDPRVIYDKRWYLKERRGFFVGMNASSRLSTNFQTGSKDTYTDLSSLKLSIGHGRLENVSTVFQSIRINNQMSPISNPAQNEIFSLADHLRGFDYTTILDSRYNSIENTATYLDALKELGYELNDFHQISNAIDAYRFERPGVVYSGTRIDIGIRPSYSFSNEDFDVSANANFDYFKPINDKWHWSNSLSLYYYNDAKRFAAQNLTRASFFPNGRTTISLSQSISYSDANSIFSVNSLSLNTNVNAKYFVSPNLSLFGGISLNFRDVNNSNYSNQIANNFGFQYYFI